MVTRTALAGCTHTHARRYVLPAAGSLRSLGQARWRGQRHSTAGRSGHQLQESKQLNRTQQNAQHLPGTAEDYATHTGKAGRQQPLLLWPAAVATVKPSRNRGTTQRQKTRVGRVAGWEGQQSHCSLHRQQRGQGEERTAGVFLWRNHS